MKSPQPLIAIITHDTEASPLLLHDDDLEIESTAQHVGGHLCNL